MSVYACDYYFGVGGDDGAAGNTFAARWRTLQKALDTVVNVTAGTIVTVGMVSAGGTAAGEIITARIDDDTNACVAGAQMRFIALEADGSYLPTSTYYLDANSSALTNTNMFSGSLAVNNKSFIGLGFKNCLATAIFGGTGLVNSGYLFIRPRFLNIGTNCIQIGTNGNNWKFVDAYANGCVSFFAGTTTGAVTMIRPVIINATMATAGVGCIQLSSAAGNYVSNPILSGCVNGISGGAAASSSNIVVGLIADRCTGTVYYGGVTASVPSFLVDPRITNCTYAFFAIAATNSIYVKRGYFYNNTKINPASLGLVIYSADCVDMASSGETGAGNLTLLNGATPAEGRWLADYIDANMTRYTTVGLLPNPDFPSAANTRPPDTTDGVTGTQTALATDADYLALEAARNKFNTGSSVADLLLTKSVKLLNVDNNGTYTGVVAPGAVTISSADGISPTAIRVNFSWVANASHIYIERSSTPLGSYTQVADKTSGNYFDDTVTAGQTWYYRARASNDSGYGTYGTVVEGVARTTNEIEQGLWTTFKTKMQADSYLAAYIERWKFDKAEAILPPGKFPVFKAWILSTREEWISVPKRKVVIPRIIIHGLVKVKNSVNLEAEKLKMDEYIKNAIEAEMTFSGGVTMNIVGDTIFRNLDDSTAEIFVECDVMSKIFVAGQR